MALRTLGHLRNAAGTDTLPLGMTFHEVLTLASIVESEAGVDEERPRIAQVYLNRLRMGMRLQADPTVAYGIGMVPRSRLRYSHLIKESPFNTYLHEGLPPGPICNPSRASIDAVIRPSPHERELYFVARGQGRHHFARTYEEHLENIRRVRAPRDTLPPVPGADSVAMSAAPAQARSAP
jgi:UPF0755 protein